MAYIVTKSSGQTLVAITDDTVDTSATSLALVGKNYAGYGIFLNENFVRLLENFASSTAPNSPLNGQLWWDSANNLLKIWTGGIWKQIHTSVASATAPMAEITGDLWWDVVNLQLKIWSGSSWILIGPGAGGSTSGGSTGTSSSTSGASVDTIVDTFSLSHIVVKFSIQGNTIGIVSRDAIFIPQSPIAGFSTIYPGFNLISSSTISGSQFTGTASNASALNNLSASQFLRSDISSTANGYLSVANDLGLTVGSTATVTISVGSGGVINVTNNTLGKDLNLNVNKGGTSTPVLQLSATTGNVTFNGANGTLLTATQPFLTTTLNLTSVGTIAVGTWQANIISPTYGGTGKNNGSNTITLAGNLTTTSTWLLNQNVAIGSAPTISGANIAASSIPNASLANANVIINGVTVNLGASATISSYAIGSVNNASLANANVIINGGVYTLGSSGSLPIASVTNAMLANANVIINNTVIPLGGQGFISAANISANASTLGGTYIAPTVFGSSLTQVGTLTGLTVSAGIVPSANNSIALGSTGAWWSNVSANVYTGTAATFTGNVIAGNVTTTYLTATYISGDGSRLTGLPTAYSNVQVATYLPTYSGGFGTVSGITTSATVAPSTTNTINLGTSTAYWNSLYATTHYGTTGTFTGAVSASTVNAGAVNAVTFGNTGATFSGASGTFTGTLNAATFSGSGASLTSIPNSALTNSSITVNGTAISLGSTGTVTAAAGTLTGTTLSTTVTASSLTSVGTLTGLTLSGAAIPNANATVGLGSLTAWYGTLYASSHIGVGGLFAGTVTAGTFAGSGASLTSVPAGQLSGTIPSGVLGASTHYIGTTAIALNRAASAQQLTGIQGIDGGALAIRQTDGTSLLVPASQIPGLGSRATDLAPNTYNTGIFSEFKNSSLYGVTGNYSGLVTYANWLGTTASTGDPSYQLLFSPAAVNSTAAPTLRLRAGIDAAWGAWNVVLHSSNFGTYATKVDGTNATGTWSISTSGNAATATAAQNGQFFTTGQVSEGQIGANFTGQSPVYLYNNATAWGLYSASGGTLITYTRATGAITTATLTNTQTTSLGVGTAASGTAGEIRAINAITSYYSDSRLKENITPIANALDKVLKISGVTFNSNDAAEKYGYTNKAQQVGVIAQEVEQVLPQIVVPAPFDIGQNEDGTEYSISGENYKTVQYEKLVPLLIEAIKELKQEIEQLKAK